MPSSLNAGLVGARRADVRLSVVSLGLAAALMRAAEDAGRYG